VKINKAVPLLQTSMTLSEIASSLSFSDQFHFSKVFKKYMEISPSEYRKLISDESIEQKSLKP
jgi:AraC-like DNA-binding protein